MGRHGITPIIAHSTQVVFLGVRHHSSPRAAANPFLTSSITAMIIYGPKNVPYDVDLGPVLLTDHYHQEYFQIVEAVMAPGVSSRLFVFPCVFP